MQSTILLSILLTLLQLIRSSKIVNIYGQLVFEQQIKNKNTQLKPNLGQLRTISIKLNDGLYQGFLDINDYTFSINNIKPGKYSMQIQSIDFDFPKFIVEVFSTGSTKVSMINPSTMKLTQQLDPLRISSRQRQYFEVQEEWTVGSLFQSQYSFFIGITLIILVLAKYMPNLEEMQERERQEQEQRRLHQQRQQEIQQKRYQQRQ